MLGGADGDREAFALAHATIPVEPTVDQRLRRAVLLVLTFATVGCDQATKHLARAHLAGAPRRSFLADTVRIDYVENTGAFLSLGATLPARARVALFTVGAAGLLAVLGGVYLRGRWSALQLVGIGLAWAGGVSNLIDRAAFGRVSDFLNVGVGGLRTGIFNVADMAITLGLLLVASEPLFARRSRQP